ncbi:pregnancy zone protein-like isoform X2 [Dendrobates tinctorius]|uniref:pregnancy zone protein-like isoform X2 n=1 Tax=Dendrobates tinctorius TaxID=92724 RepID=UPI003CC943E7
MGPAAPALLLSSPTETSVDVADNDEGGSRSTPRAFFPETIKLTGSAKMPVSVPDAGSGGLGLSSPVHLKTFQPFFVELTLPYSVIRGEKYSIKVSVLNSMSHAMKIDISLPSSKQSRLKNEENGKKSFCLTGGEKMTTHFDVTPMTLGQVNVTIIAEAVNSEELCDGQEPRVPREVHKDVVIKTVVGGMDDEVYLSAYITIGLLEVILQ